MPVPSSITALSPTAGLNSPAGSESPGTADDYFRVHASFIAQLRAALGGTASADIPVSIQNANPLCTASGTANAITLTPQTGVTIAALFDRLRVCARISVTNTGATTVNLAGLGAKTCVTVTGAALPAGYIRANALTEFTYDLVNDRFVLSRDVEYGVNANGEYIKADNGTMICWNAGITTGSTPTTAAGALFITGLLTWTLPATFSTAQVSGP